MIWIQNGFANGKNEIICLFVGRRNSLAESIYVKKISSFLTSSVGCNHNVVATFYMKLFRRLILLFEKEFCVRFK